MNHDEYNKEVPFPSTEYIIENPDMFEQVVISEVPKYLNGLAEKYRMHFKVISCTENAMFNDKCCMIIGIDNRDGVIMNITFLENGRRVEFIMNGFLMKKFDDSDREGINPEWKYLPERIRNELIIISHGLDSKWSDLLNGDMSWYEDFKKTSFYHELTIYSEERNQILGEIFAWQQGQNNG